MAVSAVAAVQYDVPHSLAASMEDLGCTLPDDFRVQNFIAQSHDNGQTLQTFDFVYNDGNTNVTTPCHFNASTVAAPAREVERHASPARMKWSSLSGKMLP